MPKGDRPFALLLSGAVLLLIPRGGSSAYVAPEVSSVKTLTGSVTSSTSNAVATAAGACGVDDRAALVARSGNACACASCALCVKSLAALLTRSRNACTLTTLTIGVDHVATVLARKPIQSNCRTESSRTSKHKTDAKWNTYPCEREYCTYRE